MLEIKRGDLMPPLTGIITDNGDPVNGTTAVLARVIAWRDGALLFRRPVTIGADGTWTMPWVEGDTDQVGDLLIEVEVTWPGTRPQTFPGDGYETVRVHQDLG